MPTSRQPVSWQVRARTHVATADASHHAELQSAQPGRLAPGHIWTQALPGHRDQIRAARIFVHEILGNTPVADDAVLICSELTTNAVLHSQSGQPGGRFVLTIEVWNGDHAWIGVHDQGGHWMHGQSGPGGRGLGIVGQLATHWDVRGDNTGRSIYARLDWPDSEQPP